ncbi:uncharacterized protein [Temnothorax longispinosus]|uniref:uncharacterized protein n=1 Tax=Temnothorax longispinosus TaxID=300112 RepID=UPI003A99B8F3
MSEEYCRNAKDIQTKIKKLRSEYIKKKPKSGGTPPDDFPFYDVLHKLWSEKDIFNDELLDDSMVDDNSDDNSSNEDPEGEELLKDVEFDYSPENNSGHSRGDTNQNQNPTKSNEKIRQLKVKRIPPRKVGKSDESRLVEILIQSNADDTKRLQEMDERQKRAEERDMALNTSLKQFLDTQVLYMNLLMGQHKDSNLSSSIRTSQREIINDSCYEEVPHKLSAMSKLNNHKEAELASRSKCSPKILSNNILLQKVNFVKSSITTDINESISNSLCAEKSNQQLFNKATNKNRNKSSEFANLNVNNNTAASSNKSFSPILPSIDNNQEGVNLEQDPSNTCIIKKPFANLTNVNFEESGEQYEQINIDENNVLAIKNRIFLENNIDVEAPFTELERNCNNKRHVTDINKSEVQSHFTTKKRGLEIKAEICGNFSQKDIKKKKDALTSGLKSAAILKEDNLRNKVSYPESASFNTQVPIITKNTTEGIECINSYSRPEHNIKQYKPVLLKFKK